MLTNSIQRVLGSILTTATNMYMKRNCQYSDMNQVNFQTSHILNVPQGMDNIQIKLWYNEAITVTHLR